MTSYPLFTDGGCQPYC